MPKNLIQQLRSVSPIHQRQLAFDLAEQAARGDKTAYEELLRMAGGENFSLLKRYSSEAQLAGIEALGKTGLPHALACLKSWQEYREVYTESCTGLACGSDHHPEWSAIKYDFFNAPKNLREKLAYTGPRFSLGESAPKPMSSEEHIKIRASHPYHSVILRAVEQLEQVQQKGEIFNNKR